MAHMLHPKTGEDVRTEEVCEPNPPDYEHEMETVDADGNVVPDPSHLTSWSYMACGYELRCRHCGMYW